MQTARFTRALHLIASDLKMGRFVEYLHRYTQRGPNIGIPDKEKDEFAELLFESRLAFEQIKKETDVARIMQTFGIDELYTPKRLSKMITVVRTAATTQSIWSNPEAYIEFFTVSEMLGWFLRMEKTCSDLLEGERRGETTPEQSVEIDVADYDGKGVDIERVKSVFVSLAELNANIARMLGISGAPAKVFMLDSGSDLKISLAVDPAIATAIKEFFSEFWDKIRFWKYEDFDRKMESVAKGLKLHATIKAQIENKVIDEETGRNLQHRVLSGMFELVGNGATLSADDASDKEERRKLLAEKKDIKLLGSGENKTG